jgi:hypothetical protein
MLVCGEWVQEEVLAQVPHRQFVFTLPKLLRHYFHRRAYLGELCRMIGKRLKQNYREVLKEGEPGFIAFVQTFGDLVTFNPHIHVLCANGMFKDNGVFRVLGFGFLRRPTSSIHAVVPPPPVELLAEQFRRDVLDFLVEEGAITDDLRERLLSWQHSGFSVHHDVKVKARDAAGQQQPGHAQAS